MKHTIAEWKILTLLALIVVSVTGYQIWITEAVSDHVVLDESNIANDATPIDSKFKQAAPLKPVEEELLASSQDVESEVTKLDAQTKDKLELTSDEPEQTYFATATPNDPAYPQWYTDIIQAPEGWDITTGDDEVVIAVIDSGFALKHEELAGAWQTNAAELGSTSAGDVCWVGYIENKATNNCDDDQNGYVDDVTGWDFANNDKNAEAGDNSQNGSNHGTKSAGLVGGRTNNNLGVASINWDVRIMPLQALHDEGYGFSSEIANAIVYAVDNGADVINLSLGGPTPDSTMYAAIRYASNNGVIVVASSGNCGAEQISSSCTGFPSPGGMAYPARYPETIAVGATDAQNNRASFSSYGPELDLVAPGSGTIQTPNWSTTNSTSAYSASSYGTSFSSPIVAGMIGLIKAQYPELIKDDVVSILRAASSKVAGMNGETRTDEYGYGLLNVISSLEEIDIYRSQLEKGEGFRVAADQKPMISTNRGHNDESPITNQDQGITYCITTPLTNCYITLTDPNTSQSIVSDVKKTNNQGLASWSIGRSTVNTPGVWEATAFSNQQISLIEELRFE